MTAYFVPAIFIAAYALFAALPQRRTLVAVIAAAVSATLMLVAGAATAGEVIRSINWNVMGIFVGTLAVADVFMESRVPAFLAERMVNRSKSVGGALIMICLLTSVISAFVENVATVLIVAPIALALTRKLDIDPVPVMIGIAVSSNLQGAATLIGDPPSMLLGGYAGMNFTDFFFYMGRPSIFFMVESGAVFSLGVLWLFYRSHTRKASLVAEEKVASWVPTIMLGVMIVLLAASSFIFPDFHDAPGIICMVLGAAAVVFKKARHNASIRATTRGLDWDTTLFLASVFVLVGSLTLTGWIGRAADFITSVTEGNAFTAFAVLAILSVVLSAFVDNVPFLAAMLPVATRMSEGLGMEPQLLLFALLIGASLGGNITPIGASANIVACGLLRKEGRPVGFGGFMRIGVPFTLAALAPALALLWLVWR